MDIPNSERAHVLVQALPYIKKYAGKTVVVKYGGNAMLDETLKSAVMSDIVLMQLVGINVVVVHGGGPEIAETLEQSGKAAPTMDMVQMVLCGKENKDLVSMLNRGAINTRALVTHTYPLEEFRTMFDVVPECEPQELERAARTSVALDK